jgi:hypothetical protein
VQSGVAGHRKHYLGKRRPMTSVTIAIGPCCGAVSPCERNAEATYSLSDISGGSRTCFSPGWRRPPHHFRCAALPLWGRTETRSHRNSSSYRVAPCPVSGAGGQHSRALECGAVRTGWKTAGPVTEICGRYLELLHRPAVGKSAVGSSFASLGSAAPVQSIASAFAEDGRRGATLPACARFATSPN